MKKKAEGKQPMEELWAHAVERAREDKRADAELEREALNDAAGLHVQSGVQAGGWISSISCQGTNCCYQG